MNCFCDYEQPDVYISKIVKAKKSHYCCECNVEILSKQKYEYVKILFEGKWRHFHTCLNCIELKNFTINNIPRSCISHGNLIEDCKDSIEDAITRAPEETKGLWFGFLKKLYKIKLAKNR